jgi:hypothetical protein
MGEFYMSKMFQPQTVLCPRCSEFELKGLVDLWQCLSALSRNDKRAWTHCSNRLQDLDAVRIEAVCTPVYSGLTQSETKKYWCSWTWEIRIECSLIERQKLESQFDIPGCNFETYNWLKCGCQNYASYKDTGFQNKIVFVLKICEGNTKCTHFTILWRVMDIFLLLFDEALLTPWHVTLEIIN